ncbi:MAG: response regulator [Acetobacteraceae bacterium]|nr:response regulator [Acetobacteraceae bacterium]
MGNLVAAGALPRKLRQRLRSMMLFLVLAPFLGSALFLSRGLFAGYPTAGTVGVPGIGARDAAVIAIIIASLEVLTALLAWPIVDRAVRCGELLAAALRRRDRARAGEQETASGPAYDVVLHRIAGRFVHDVNNVFSMILLCAAAAERATINPAVFEAVQRIAASARDGLEVGQRFLALGEMFPQPSEPVDANDVIYANAAALADQVCDRCELVLALSPRPVPVAVDPERLLRCVLELMANASAASAAGGVIHLRTRNEFAERVEQGRTLLSVIEVEDRGVGMRPDDIARAMSARFDGSGPAGLGLAIVASIMRRAGGSIDISSSPANGTRVRLRLPAARMRRTLSAPAQAPTVPRLGARVLIVDDNAEMRSIIGDCLEKRGFLVLQGDDAASATAHLEQGVDVLITDVVLPDIDGFALARHARRLDPEIPLIFVSGFISARQPEVLGSDDLAGFMRKPIDLGNLLDLVAGLLAVRDAVRSATIACPLLDASRQRRHSR